MTGLLDPRQTVIALRERAFGAPPEDLAAPAGPDSPDIRALFMELGVPEAWATPVTLCDGSTSLYLSVGGGVIGAGKHAAVREASTLFLLEGQARLQHRAPATGHPFPPAGHVNFHARTPGGWRSAQVAEAALASRRHALSGLFLKGHMLLARIRKLTEGLD